MDASPETDRRDAAAANSSSPIVQDSPFSNFLSSLTPIDDLKSECFSQRLIGAFLPTPPVVFTSPRTERENNFLDRTNTVEVDVSKQRKTTLFKSSGFDKVVQSGDDASSCIDEYMVDPASKVDGTNSADKLSTVSARKASDADVHENIEGSTKSEILATLNQAEEDIQLPSLKQINATVIERTGEDSVAHETRGQSLGHNTPKEVSQHQRGIRRHLQFGSAVAQNNSSFASYDSLRSTHAANVSPQGVLYESVRSGQFGGNSSTFPYTNSGVGLHLNSIAQSTPMSSDVFSVRKSIGCLNTLDHMVEHRNMELESSSSFISAVAQQNYSCMTNNQQGSQTAVQTTFNYYSVNPTPFLPYNSTDHMLVDRDSVSFKEMNASENANKIEESNQLSQKKKSKSGADISDGCKRCNCKKSKCLKLYCECFAAGVFCLDSCSCENCYNKPEFEDTVFDARQQIESRNPLAFAPRVVTHEFNSLPKIMEEADRTTPSSARHKRGCNCKKSKCLKKYCECYQANVGCSSACRCDGCQNPCGTITDQENNRAANSVKGGDECIKATNMDQYSPLEELSVSSASASMRNCTKKSQVQLQSSRPQPPVTTQLKQGRSPVIFTQQVFDCKGPYQLSSGSISYERMDDEMPEFLKEPPIPSKVVTGSPNKKRVLSPQTRAEKLRSRSPKALRSGRKFLLRTVSSFPSLSPYSDSKVTNDTRNGHEGTCNN